MDNQRPYIVLLLAVSVTVLAMWFGWAGIFIVAFIGTALTVGLRTGSLAPYYPTVSRTNAPVKFWLIMGACAAVVVANVVNLALRF